MIKFENNVYDNVLVYVVSFLTNHVKIDLPAMRIYFNDEVR